MNLKNCSHSKKRKIRWFCRRFDEKIFAHKDRFQRFLRKGCKKYTDFVESSDDFQTFYFFSLLANLNYFSGINSMEEIVKLLQLMKLKKIEPLIETLKNVLLKNGIDIEHEILMLLPQ